MSASNRSWSASSLRRFRALQTKKGRSEHVGDLAMRQPLEEERHRLAMPERQSACRREEAAAAFLALVHDRRVLPRARDRAVLVIGDVLVHRPALREEGERAVVRDAEEDAPACSETSRASRASDGSTVALSTISGHERTVRGHGKTLQSSPRFCSDGARIQGRKEGKDERRSIARRVTRAALDEVAGLGYRPRILAFPSDFASSCWR